MTHVLILEDDEIIAQQIADFLNGNTFHCTITSNGPQFLLQLQHHHFDIYLLDIQVPEINGLDICTQIRVKDQHTPILMLTAFGEIQDKKEAFERGADDYLVKPFLLEELQLRIQSLLRRNLSTHQTINKIIIDDLIINITDKIVHRSGKEIKLTAKEFQLLSILVRANGRILSKRQIAEELWDAHIAGNDNTIEVYINFLRNKIDKPFGKPLLHTKIGFGYYIKNNP